MRQRDAERIARRFVAARYPECAGWSIDLAPEHDGERRTSWSFGVRPDEEDEDAEQTGHDTARGLVGYVKADGSVEGLY